MKDGMKRACPARQQHLHDISLEAGKLSAAAGLASFKDCLSAS
jgi:hypothetical protein